MIVKDTEHEYRIYPFTEQELLDRLYGNEADRNRHLRMLAYISVNKDTKEIVLGFSNLKLDAGQTISFIQALHRARTIIFFLQKQEVAL